MVLSMAIFLNPNHTWQWKKLSNDAKTMFTDTSITITTDGRKYLGAVVGSDTCQV